MSRVADSTMKGFLYQFCLTLKQVLETDSTTEVQVEGIIEDIDVITPDLTTAIQCKYHADQNSFALSTIYKPILQMLKHYTSNSDKNIQYRLHVYFPSANEGERLLTHEELDTILQTNNIDLISKYVSIIKPPQDPSIESIVIKAKKTKTDKESIKDYYNNHNPAPICDLSTFVDSRFVLIFGKSYEILEAETQALMIREDITETDVTDIFFPNAIHKIATISSIRNDEERIISREWLFHELTKMKKTAISRWTKEITNYKKLLKVRTNQLGKNLNKNSRERYFIIDRCNFSDFDEGIVLFLKDYIDEYCHKPLLHTPASIFIRNSDKSSIDNIVSRLFTIHFEVETGYRGSTFYKEAFLRRPERKIKPNWIQFGLRISSFNSDIVDIINENKPDDLFIIGKESPNVIDTMDVNCECLDVYNFEELKFLLKLTKEI